MAEAILFNGPQTIYDKNYNWNEAFNDPEFIDYILYPSEYTGYELEIPAYGYSGAGFQTCYFPSCYKHIGSHAFENCRKLESAFFPSNIYDMELASHKIQDVGSYAFTGCSSLKMININTVRNVGEYAFYGCTQLSNYYAMGSAYNEDVYIGSNAFDGCRELVSCGVAGSVRYIHPYAFRNCSKLTDYYGFLAFPGLKVVGSHAFENCYSLSSITNIGTNETNCQINEYAFYNCYNISMVTTGVSYIAPYAFANCSRLSNIVGPYRLYYIGSHAFENCDLMEMNMGMFSLVHIGAQAFKNCSNMSSIFIPAVSSVPYLESIDAFDGIQSDYRITVPTSLKDDFLAHSVWGLLSDHIYY